MTHRSVTSDRPSRPPEVIPVGVMPDSAFTDQQWLVRRRAQFVQVSELLYRIIEHANGDRTVAEIADLCTRDSEWLVTPEVVRTLVETKLAPAGLVRDNAEDSSEPVPQSPSPSPVDVQMHTRMISPRFIDSATRALQYLFAPPLLVPLLALCAGVHLWAYRTYDVGQAVAATLYTPGGLLVALVLLLAGALFHEFGHAAALRYGGGVVRGIGAGLYVIFPAFYTDVTDGYRLGRLARVRTDLGGVYFHLLFASLLLVASGLTGNPLLLFAALLINIDMARQFIPFVRLDGYWLLADLTGVPDFFSQMTPFLRSLRLGLPGGQRLPALKPWAKAVFATYVLLTIPVLLYLFILMVVQLPVFLTAAREAVAVQVDIVRSNDAVWRSVLALTQIALVTIPVLGSLIMIGLVSSWILSPVFARIPADTRRLGHRLVWGSGAATLLVWLALGDGSAPAATAVASGPESLVTEMREATARVQTMRADVEGTVGEDRFTGSVMLKRPNFARIEINGSEGLGAFRVFSDGKDIFTYFPAENQFTRMRASSDGRNISAFVVEQVQHFFSPNGVGFDRPGVEVAEVAPVSDNERQEYRIVRVVSPEPGRRATHYYISRSDGLAHRVSYPRIGAASGQGNWVALKNITLGEAIPDAQFVWTPPGDAGPLQLPLALDLGQGPARSAQPSR